MSVDVRIMVERLAVGDWLSLTDGDIYRVQGDTMAEYRVSMRRQETTNPYVDGTYLINAVRENVEETLSVFVYAPDHLRLVEAVDAVVDAFTQLTYRTYVEIDGSCRVWSCYAASEVSVQSGREFKHARMAQVSVTVPRLPAITHVRNLYEVMGAAVYPQEVSG